MYCERPLRVSSGHCSLEHLGGRFRPLADVSSLGDTEIFANLEKPVGASLPRSEYTYFLEKIDEQAGECEGRGSQLKRPTLGDDTDNIRY